VCGSCLTIDRSPVATASPSPISGVNPRRPRARDDPEGADRLLAPMMSMVGKRNLGATADALDERLRS
jgi:hypothetical protein